MTMPFYVAPEQVMKDRAEYAQKGIARGRSLVATIYDDGVADRGREPVALAAQDQRDLRPDRLRRGGQVQRVRPAAGGRGPPRRHQGLRLQPRGRRRPFPGQPLRPVPGQRLHPRDEAARGRDPGGRARRRGPARPAVPHRLRGDDHRRGPLRRARRRRRDHRRTGGRRPGRPTGTWPGPSGGGRRRWPAPSAPWRRATSRWRCSAGRNGRRTFRRIADDELAGLLDRGRARPAVAPRADRGPDTAALGRSRRGGRGGAPRADAGPSRARAGGTSTGGAVSRRPTAATVANGPADLRAGERVRGHLSRSAASAG